MTVDLGKFTILIGPNDSGKSSFLEAVRTLGRTCNEELPKIFAGDKSLENLVWLKKPEQNIVWEACGKVSDQPFSYKLEMPAYQRPPKERLALAHPDQLGKIVKRKIIFDTFNPTPVAALPGPPGTQSKQFIFIENRSFEVENGHTVLGSLIHCKKTGTAQIPPYVNGILSRLTSTNEFHFEPVKMCNTSVQTSDISLSESGDNLAGFLDALVGGPDRSAREKLETDLNKQVPTLQGIFLSPVAQPPGAKCLNFVLAGDASDRATIPASLASDGALLLTAFLALSYSKTPDLLLFEEPENGLHPSRLKFVVDVLRKMTTGELGGRPRQIIITTHNPLLLNFAKPEEVRVFTRDAEKGTQVRKMVSIPDAERLFKEFGLGELWYLLGEEKLFQEQPA